MTSVASLAAFGRPCGSGIVGLNGRERKGLECGDRSRAGDFLLENPERGEHHRRLEGVVFEALGKEGVEAAIAAEEEYFLDSRPARVHMSPCIHFRENSRSRL